MSGLISRTDENDAASKSISSLRISEIMAAIGQAGYVWNITDDEIRWSDNFTDLVGFNTGANVECGREFEKLLSADSPQTRFAAIQSLSGDEACQSGISYQCVYAVNADHLSGDVRVWLEDTGKYHADASGKPLRAEGVVRIINDRRRQEENLQRKSDYDALTGLPNRRYLEESIERVAASGLTEFRSFVFMLLSICEFERVNDIYGFAAGDEVLAQIAQMLSSVKREEDLVARFSGAKFGIILNNCGGDEVFLAAQRFLDKIQNQLLQTSKGPVSITAAIGASLLPRHARKSGEAISASMDALNIARREKGQRINVYDPDPAIVEKRRADAQLVGRFIGALETGAMHLAYQPVVSGKSREPVFYEALLRMDAAQDIYMEDAGFIKMAEDLGLMKLVDIHALRLALKTLKTYRHAKISLNITHESLENPEWLSCLASGLQNIEQGAERLIVEITESQLPLEITETRKVIRLIHDIGCQVAIDDFGAGYTSFANLKDLDVDIIKIDGSFCRDLKQDQRNGVFLRSLQQLAAAFDVKTVVEWVEDAQSAALMQEWGYDYLQGSLFGMPMAKEPWQKCPDINTAERDEDIKVHPA